MGCPYVSGLYRFCSQTEDLKAQVGVREMRDQLTRYLRHVDAGGEVVITMRGRRVHVCRRWTMQTRSRTYEPAGWCAIPSGAGGGRAAVRCW